MSAHLVTTKIKVTECGRCRAPILAGIAEGQPVAADPTPLTRDGEIGALVTGRATYTILGRELVRRDASRASIPGAVVADHRCGQTVPAEHIDRIPPPDWRTRIDPGAARAAVVFNHAGLAVEPLPETFTDDQPPF